MPLMNCCGYQVNVVSIAEFARGEDGLCALCHGDPCNEYSSPDSTIALFYKENEWADTCPCCNGRPS